MSLETFASGSVTQDGEHHQELQEAACCCQPLAPRGATARLAWPLPRPAVRLGSQDHQACVPHCAVGQHWQRGPSRQANLRASSKHHLAFASL